MTALLIQRLVESAPSRVIFTSSVAHYMAAVSPFAASPIDYTTLTAAIQPWEFEASWKRYGRSKLADLLIARLWSQKVSHKQVFINALHPGFVSTEIARNLDEPWIVRKIFPIANAFSLSSDKGAVTTLFAACDPRIESTPYHGQYFVPLVSTNMGSGWSRDMKVANELWKWTDDVIKEKVADSGLNEVEAYLESIKVESSKL